MANLRISLGVGRKQMRLQIEHDLQPMLDLAQEAVMLFEERALLVRQAADTLQGSDGGQRVAVAQGRQIAAVEQLQELDHELDVANAAAPGFDVVGVVAFTDRAPLDATLQGLDAGDVGQAQVTAIDPGFEIIEESFAQFEIAGHDARLDERLAFPGAALHVVVAHGPFDAVDDRAAFAFGTQPQVDAVGVSQRVLLGEQADDFSPQAVVELAVGDGVRAVGAAVGLVQKDQIDVAGVIQFDSAQLAHAEHDKPRRLAVGPHRPAALLGQPAIGKTQRRLDHGVGQEGNLFGHQFQFLVANDVAEGDPQRFAALEAAQGGHDGCLVA